MHLTSFKHYRIPSKHCKRHCKLLLSDKYFPAAECLVLGVIAVDNSAVFSTLLESISLFTTDICTKGFVMFLDIWKIVLSAHIVPPVFM